MQQNYAKLPDKEWVEYVRYDGTSPDKTRTPETALAENYLLYIGADNKQIKVKSESDMVDLSDLLVAFKKFKQPSTD